MSSAPLPLDQPPTALADRPADEVAAHLLEMMFDDSPAADLQRTLADLGNMKSPHELAEIYQFIAAMTTEDGRVQIAAMAPMWSQLLNGAGAVYRREMLFEGSILFRSALEAPLRPALVCFTSRQNGMFMPNCRFLELLGRHPVDVVMNWTDSGTFGLWDLDGAGSFAGRGKRPAEIDEAVASGIGHLVVEGLHQAQIASEAALRRGVVQRVLARISPATSPKGFGARMTGVATRFGIDEEDAAETLAEVAGLPGLVLDGLHFYAGSNSLDAAVIGANIRNCAELAQRLVASLGRLPGRLIFGAGFGVPYHEGQVALDLAEVAAEVQAALAPLVSVADVAMDLELGRWLVAPAGQMLTRVLTRKAGRGAVIAICDGGFNANLAACGMMGSVVRRNWPIRNVTMPDGVPEKLTLAGPLCTSIDLLARDLDLAQPAVGDLLAVGLSGAYGPTASPQGFISQPQVCEMIWDGHTLRDETPGEAGAQRLAVAAE